MKVRYLLLISFLIVGALFVPAVSAEYYTFNLTEESHYKSNGTETGDYATAASGRELNDLIISNAEMLYGKDITNVVTQIRGDYIRNYNDLPPSSLTTVTIGDWGRATYGYFKYNTSADVPNMQVYLSNFEVLDDYPTGLSGNRRFVLTPDADDFVFPKTTRIYAGYDKDYDLGIAIAADLTAESYYECYPKGMHYYSFTSKWNNTLTIDTQPGNDIITLNRHGLSSQIDFLTSVANYTDTTNEDYQVILAPSFHRPYSVIVTNPISGNTYRYNINTAGILDVDSVDPEPSDGQLTLRTGTVTMTDNNGTTITGFKVTAINAYTGENYTVSTGTDVAVMTLPMDRTIDIRNPQTGEYEKAPIGYYRFYGQSPGYKMLADDGIQVAVMPEQYSSYQLCDILVTSESGYLTGKHQFQIRSRSDNSILQTGTISAKSATTEVWFNTTVNGGLATLT